MIFKNKQHARQVLQQCQNDADQCNDNPQMTIVQKRSTLNSLSDLATRAFDFCTNYNESNV